MYIIFDIGGTTTRVAASEDLQTFVHVVKFNTQTTYKDGIQALQKAITEVAADRQVTALAGGIRGSLNVDRNGIMDESILIDWVDRDITGDLSGMYAAPAYLGNDSAMAALGEAVFGAGQNEHIVAYLTISTGVGGARCVNGKLDEAMVNFEPGHQVLDRNALHADTCNATLEDLVSGTALEKRSGQKPYEISQSDPVWDDLAKILGIGLVNIIMFWSPSVIVLGGSMIVGDPRIRREDIIRHTSHALKGFVPCPKIVDAELADEGGLYGAMVYLQQRQATL